jgi:hypothetical protein
MPNTIETAFDSNNIRFDITTGNFILVTAEHPCFINQASRAFVDAHPERFLTADAVAHLYATAGAVIPGVSRFPMSDGPSLPWWLAEIVYAGFSRTWLNAPGIEQMAKAGGLSWKVVEQAYASEAGRLAMNAAALAARDNGTLPEGPYCTMHKGPHIPWDLAEVIYAGYVAQFGAGRSLEQIHARGGFTWAEVAKLYEVPESRNAMDAAMRLKGFA